jgi:simple sugar transport system permease protein
MGGYASERSGVINIGLEGLILVAACAAAVAAPRFGPGGALAIALTVTILISLVHWMATQYYRIDHVISGMVINLVAAGGTNFVASLANASSSDVPHLPLGLYEGLAIVLPFGLWGYARGTRGGLRLVATGADPDKARLAGIVPERVRLVALIATGVFAGLSGAMLVAFTEGFTNDMTAGRGYIALAALVLGGWRPLPTLAACLAFGLLTALRVQYAGETVLGVSPPSEFWAALPYLATVIALAGLLGRGRTPAGLGKQ